MPPRTRARLSDVNPLSSTTPADVRTCFGCGLEDANASCTLSSPLFTAKQLRSAITNQFVPSAPAVQFESARDVVRGGEAKMALIRTAIRQLEDHLDGISHTVQRHRRFLVTILTLPNDVLLVIFEHLCFESGDDDDAPWIAAAVCKRWREVALSCSALWTRINYGEAFGDTHTDKPASVQKLKQRLEIQIPRAGPTSPLSLLYAHAERYNALEIYSHMPIQWGYSNQPVILDLRALKTLSINHISYIQNPQLRDWAPNVTDLTLRSIGFSPGTDTSNLKFPKLRRLALVSCRPTSNVLLELFQQVGEQLHELHLEGNHSSGFHYLINTAIKLPALRKLTIRFAGSPVVRSLISNIQAPQLHHLSIAGATQEELSAFHTLVRHSPRLAELTVNLNDDLTWTQSEASALIKLLSEADSLDTLSFAQLDRPHVAEEILQALVWHAPEPSSLLDPNSKKGKRRTTTNATRAPALEHQLCPALTMLRLGHLKAGVKVVRALIRSRAATTGSDGLRASLQHVSFRRSDSNGRNRLDKATWDAERNMGVEVVVG